MIRVTTEYINCKSCESPYLNVEDSENLMFAVCLECGYRFLLDILEADKGNDYDANRL